MHHAPAGPPLSSRLAVLVRRSRLVPVTVAVLVIAGVALAGPPSAVSGQQPGTAALTSPSEGRALVPATGDGWTQDGLAPTPAEPADPATGAAPDDDTPAPDVAGAAPAATAPGSSSGPAASSPGTPSTSAGPGTTTRGTSSVPPPSSPPSSDPSTTSASVSSSTPSSTSTSTSTPVPSPVAVVDDADQVLAAVNAARAASSCPPLVPDAVLAETATAHSTAMRDAAALAPPAGAGLVAGEVTDPAAVAAGWLADPALSLTDCELTTAGVGAVDGWWTLLAT